MLNSTPKRELAPMTSTNNLSLLLENTLITLSPHDSKLLAEHDSGYRKQEIVNLSFIYTMQLTKRLFQGKSLKTMNDSGRRELLYLQHLLSQAIVYKLMDFNRPNDHSADILQRFYRALALTTLAITGCIYSACQGMTGLMSFIGYFSLSQTASMIAVILFAILSAFVFFIHDYQAYAKIFGSPFRQVKSWLKDVLTIEELLQKGYGKLFEILGKPEHFHHQTEIKNIKDTFDVARRFFAANKAVIIDNSKLNSWVLWSFKYLFGHFSGAIWALSGYFVGKSAASVILGFCPYSVMVSLAAPLTIGLSTIGLFMAASAFYKGEYQAISRHVNAWAGIPENFRQQFESALRNSVSKASILDNRLSKMQSKEYQGELKNLRDQLHENHSILIRMPWPTQLSDKLLAQYKTEFRNNASIPEIDVINRLLTKQRILKNIIKVFNQHQHILLSMALLSGAHTGLKAFYKVYLERYSQLVGLDDYYDAPDLVKNTLISQRHCRAEFFKVIPELKATTTTTDTSTTNASSLIV